MIPVGTTALRALESAALRKLKGLPLGEFETDLFIHPESGHEFRVADGLFTNFHQPQSSLLLLIAEFLEPQKSGPKSLWRRLYETAIQNEFRLFSYGDAMLILPRKL